MLKDILDSFERAARPAAIVHSVVVYGAGKTGRDVGAYLRDAGVWVSAFLDAKAKEGQQLLGLPVFTLADWAARHDARTHAVVMAVHNAGANPHELSATLRAAGFARVLSMLDFVELFPENQPFRYWLAPSSYYRDHIHVIERLPSYFDDDESRGWLNAVLRYRLLRDASTLPKPDPAHQYFPPTLPRWREPLRFVDCGAFDGDTIARLAEGGGYAFERIAAFEPDPATFPRLVSSVRSIGNATCFPCGVGAESRAVRFHAGDGPASRRSDAGESVIQCVALDDAIYDFDPTFIKMDVEGSEPDALVGASKLIARSRPGLAICVYHHPSHLWMIPQMIRSWELGYQLYLRGHGHGGFEMVLYAVPSK